MRAHYLLSKPGELAHCLQSRQSVKSCSRHYLCFLIGGADPTRRFFYTRAGKSYIEQKRRRRIQGGRKCRKRRGPFGSAEGGCAGGAGRAAPVFLPGTCFVKSSLFISQSDYKRRSIFRFCGDSVRLSGSLRSIKPPQIPPPSL